MIDFLKALAKASGMRHGHIDPMLEALPINRGKAVRTIPKNIEKQFGPKNIIYGPFRRFAKIPKIGKYKSVMVLRDPRDVLVSLFFAQLYSHGPPPDPQQRVEYRRKTTQARKDGIDKTVLQWADNMVRFYGAYMEAQQAHRIPLLTYEFMVTDFKKFLRKFLDICSLEEFYQPMLKFNRFKPPKEDIYAHKRQITPGDHRRKLKAATIEKLNQKLGHITGWLGL